MNVELIESLKLLEKERGIEPELIFEAIEEALVSAYKREFEIKEADNIRAEVDRETGSMNVFLTKVVVETVTDPHSQTSLEEAKALSDDFEIDDELLYQISPNDLGRLAANTAKAVISQRMARAESERIFAEFSDKIGQLVVGVVQRKDRGNVLVDIGRAEAVLEYKEKSRLDGYNFNQRMKFLVLSVSEERSRPVIRISRSSEKFIQRLFEQEVPEISTGVVEIVSIAREAGSRTKLAVSSSDENVDAVGSCVGQRGMRVQNVIDELNGEKIDIIEWDQDPINFISHALSPAKVLRVDLDLEDKSAVVVVPDNQQSLAIGREGQNARLAAKLTEWSIDVRSESDYRSSLEEEIYSKFDQALDNVINSDQAEGLEVVDIEVVSDGEGDS